MGRDFRYVKDWGPGPDWTHYIQGPALAILSWIPYYGSRDGLPECDLKSRWNEDPAIGQLLGLGNRRPNERLDSVGEFLRQLELKDFRTALAIDAPKLYLDKTGKVTGVTFIPMGRVGHTRKRVGPFEIWPEGIGEGDYDVYPQPMGRIFECWYRFKIGWPGNWFARAKTGHWPPWAIVKVTYVMEDSGRVTITVLGSHVPSYTVYVDWESKCEYRMEYDCTAGRFREFVEAGGCADAPISAIYRIQCEGQETTPA